MKVLKITNIKKLLKLILTLTIKNNNNVTNMIELET